MSPRADRPLVLVDCSAITATLIESELFGHERGAFTGADKKYSGRLAEADGGTLFLDEIGELPLEVQSKLLDFVQDKVYKSVGSNEQKSVDVRIICATNRNLNQDVEDGNFAETFSIESMSLLWNFRDSRNVQEIFHFSLNTLSRNSISNTKKGFEVRAAPPSKRCFGTVGQAIYENYKLHHAGGHFSPR